MTSVITKNSRNGILFYLSTTFAAFAAGPYIVKNLRKSPLTHYNLKGTYCYSLEFDMMLLQLSLRQNS